MHSLRWRPLLATLALTSLLSWSAVLAQAPPPPAPPPQVLSFASDGGTWAWLHGTAEEARLLVGPPGQPGKELARGKGWREAALTGDDSWVLSQAGELLRVPKAGGEPETVLRGLHGAGGLRGVDGNLYWLEVSDPGTRPAFVPTAGPAVQLRRRSAAGEVRSLGSWPGAPLPAGKPLAGDVLAITPEDAYLRIHRAASTEFVRLSLKSGEGERLAAESGEQTAVLAADTLYWTAPSDEASASSLISMVRRRDGDGAIEDVTDWLPAGGTLLAEGSQVFYARNRLFRLPRRLQPAQAGLKLPWSASIAGDGPRLVALTPAGPAFAGEMR